jgi:hypothetical protein
MKPLLVVALLAVATTAGTTGCSRSVSGSGAIAGTSDTVTVRGTYARVALDRVDRVSIEGGKLVLHGSSSTVEVDLPPAADPAKPDPHWALATEGDNGRARVLTFTHDMSLDDFTIELPRSQAPIRFGGLSGRDGNDVLILAWGEESQSYHAELTITPIPKTSGSPTP